ncbi:MAG: BON domain-containing protein, partial [Ktedonobacterales bacterium]|nr:BON domain-containing protein [Ktedonobacterales bacterium]
PETSPTDQQRQLTEERDLRITAAETEDTIILSGTVPSEEDRAAAARAAASLAPGKRVENLLEVERLVPDGHNPEWTDNANMEPLFASSDDASDGSPNPDFMGQSLDTDTLTVEDSGAQEDQPTSVAEPDSPFFPPVDPVIMTNTDGSVDVLGGFSPDAMAEMSVAPSTEDNVPGDEALVEAIQRELREDALTTSLRVDIVVERGVARLRGTVPDLEDAEHVEAVANRVPGVREVVEELDVTRM